MSQDYDKIAKEILANLGEEENVSNVTHCMTRLRFNLKDESIVNDEKIKAIDGVLGIGRSGGQYQIIIGQTVEKVYESIIKITALGSEQPPSNTESEKKKLTFKGMGNKILDGLAGSLTPLIPVLVAASMFKMVVAVLGPDMLGIIQEESQLFTLLTFVGDAGFYFFPVMIGYTASKKFNATPVLGMFLGAILIHPTLMEIAENGVGFSVYGIPASAENYTSTVIPIILAVWVMSYIEKYLKRIIPATLSTVFTPTLTVVIMLPIMLVVLGPIGFFIGDYISRFLLSLDTSVGGFLAVAIIAALWQFLVMTGMHLLMITTMITVFAQSGQESVVSPAGLIASMCVAGMSFGTFLKLKNKEEKALAFGFLTASFVGGVTEPAMYGLGMRYKKPFIGMVIGGFVGGLYAGVTGVTTYSLIPVASFISMTGFFGGTTANTINGFISCIIGFIVAAVVSYVLGVNDNQKEAIEVEENLVKS